MDDHDFSDGRRGPVVRAPEGTTRITIRLDEDVIRWFKDEVDRTGGGSYQALINAALRKSSRTDRRNDRRNEPMSPLWRCRRRDDELRPEYDFSAMAGAARGKYLERAQGGEGFRRYLSTSLDPEERELLGSFEAGEWRRVAGFTPAAGKNPRPAEDPPARNSETRRPPRRRRRHASAVLMLATLAAVAWVLLRPRSCVRCRSEEARDRRARGGEPPLTPAQEREFVARLREYRENPDDVIPWEELEASLRSSEETK